MHRDRPVRRARLVLLALPLLLASRPGAAAPAVKRADAVFPKEVVEALAPDQRTTPFSFSVFRGLSQSEAEVVFGAAEAAVYVENGGLVYALTNPSAPRAVERWLERRPSRATASPFAKARLLRVTTAEGFASAVNSLLPGLTRGAYGGYMSKFPLQVELPEGVAAAAPPKGRSPKAARPASLATAGTVLSETFETDPFASRWTTIDLDADAGAITWGWTICDAHAGTHSVDGARGGATGSGIGCASLYPANQFNLMRYNTYMDLTGGTTQAWMETFMNMNMENNPNNDFIALLFRNPLHQSSLNGFRFSGNQVGAWWRFLFNLKQWTPFVDLTQTTDNLFYLAWGSSPSTQTGFGARLDDLTITTDTTPAMTCNASVNVAYGQVPLSVILTGSAAGGTGTETYLWDPKDGAQVAGKVLSHTYTVPGEYFPIVFVTDVLSGVTTRCTASLHVTAARSATGPSPTNDVCSAAKLIPTNTFNESFSAVGFTQDPDEPQPCGPAIGATAWYKFVAPSAGTALISLCSSAYDTVLAVYTGACGGFTNKYCNDDEATCGANPAASKLTSVQMKNATTYWIQVGASGGFGSAPGAATLNFTFTPGASGDANGDGFVNSSDIFFLINYLFAGGGTPTGPADPNGDGLVNSGDIFYLINYLFAGGPAPV